MNDTLGNIFNPERQVTKEEADWLALQKGREEILFAAEHVLPLVPNADNTEKVSLLMTFMMAEGAQEVATKGHLSELQAEFKSLLEQSSQTDDYLPLVQKFPEYSDEDYAEYAKKGWKLGPMEVRIPTIREGLHKPWIQTLLLISKRSLTVERIIEILRQIDDNTPVGDIIALAKKTVKVQ